MQSLEKISLKDLYDEDYLAWHEVTLKQIKNRNLTALDLETLTEVLENILRKKEIIFIKNLLNI